MSLILYFMVMENSLKRFLQILFILSVLPFSIVGATHIISYQPIDVVEPSFEIWSQWSSPPLQEGEIIHSFLRGDANIDGKVDISDLMAISNFINNRGTLDCKDAGDINDDGEISMADLFYLRSWLFLGGSPPKYPFPERGFDDFTEDGLGCGFYG